MSTHILQNNNKCSKVRSNCLWQQAVCHARMRSPVKNHVAKIMAAMTRLVDSRGDVGGMKAKEQPA